MTRGTRGERTPSTGSDLTRAEETAARLIVSRVEHERDLVGIPRGACRRYFGPTTSLSPSPPLPPSLTKSDVSKSLACVLQLAIGRHVTPPASRLPPSAPPPLLPVRFTRTPRESESILETPLTELLDGSRCKVNRRFTNSCLEDLEEGGGNLDG